MISQDKMLNSNGTALLDFCKQTNLRILNGRFGSDKNIGKFTCHTHRGESVVDYVLASTDLLPLVRDFSIGDPNILSDHSKVEFSFSNFGYVNVERMSDEKAEFIQYTYKWDSSLMDDYKTSLSSENTTRIFEQARSVLSLDTASTDDIDYSLNLIVEGIESCTKPLFSKQCHIKNSDNTFKDNNLPWFDEDCNIKRQEFYLCLNVYRTDKTDINRINMVTAWSSYKKTLRKAKFKFDKYQTDRLNDLRHKNAKEYWKLLKTASHIKPKIPLNNFAAYFRAVNNPDSPFYTPDEDTIFFYERYVKGEIQVMFSELDLPISVDEICTAINQLSNGKSSGPDRLLNEFFIYGKDVLMPYLHILFNKLFTSSHFPEVWSMGEVIPLHKKGDKSNVDNYRGITLLSTFGKLFTRILNNRLTSWAESYAVYIEAQAGFREQMCTADNIFVLHGLITHFLNSNKQLFCSFIDFSKAFDYVVRDILWFKLLQFGVRGKMLDIIMSMYENAKSRVRLNNKLGEEFTCMTGVRQGECLSPFLFAMYLNDIEQEFITKGADGVDTGLLKLFLLLYADDIVIFSENAHGLQDGLNILHEYCQKWKLTVNPNKSKIMVFRKGGRLPQNLQFQYGDTVLEITSKFTYLGIVFTSGGSFSEAQATLSGQAQKAIFALNKHLNRFVNVSPSHVLDLFDKLISPILCYASEVWGFSKANSIERVHMQFCKKLLCVKQCTQNDFIYGELGRYQFQTKRFYNIIKYWLKIVCCQDTKYVKIVYEMLLNDSNTYPNKVSWVILVRNLLGELGFMEAWLQQGVGDAKLFLRAVKQRLEDTFIQNWNARLNESSRALFYRNFNIFGYKNYLDHITKEKNRFAFARLSLSLHRLEVEVGRWAKPNAIPFENRLCSTCGILEDEFHFTLKCTRYTDLRNSLLPKYFRTRPNMHKLIELFASESKQLIRKLSLYVFKAFKTREQYVFT
ncbi:MAG: hypothetical protein JAZ03_11525 [Candidatus Thiodiazotropha taylori]|nr:hypothetical protein [Candidatus Thiodiazotropha taylori]MCW4334554.1 reverse transcriptase domain-containing protein [Candidatus Thiodiazotropha endolucinida]